jgi:hypothetical protein
MVMLRKAGLALAVLLAAMAAFVAPSPASAATSCSGSLIDSAPIKAGTKTYGTLSVYYNSSTRKNCAKATNATGARQWMSVWVFRCESGTGSTVKNCSPLDSPTQGINYDSGDYVSYAGPVNTKGVSAGLCIYAGASMEVGSAYPAASIGGHCG